MMDSAKIFQTGRSQAVRLPKAYRFEGSQVFVKRVGRAVVLMPDENSWDLLFDACDAFSEDFLRERREPERQQRPEFERVRGLRVEDWTAGGPV